MPIGYWREEDAVEVVEVAHVEDETGESWGRTALGVQAHADVVVGDAARQPEVRGGPTEGGERRPVAGGLGDRVGDEGEMVVSRDHSRHLARRRRVVGGCEQTPPCLQRGTVPLLDERKYILV